MLREKMLRSLRDEIDVAEIELTSYNLRVMYTVHVRWYMAAHSCIICRATKNRILRKNSILKISYRGCHIFLKTY